MSIGLKDFLRFFFLLILTISSVKSISERIGTKLQQSIEGSTVKLRCALRFKGHNPSWEFKHCGIDDNQTICEDLLENHNWTYLPQKTSIITLKNVTTNQSGLYRCRESATALINVYSTIELQVFGYGTGEDLKPPRFVEKMPDVVKVPYMGRVTLHCKVASRTTPKIIWLREGAGSIHYNDKYYDRINSTGEISISPQMYLSKTVVADITPEKQGFYNCLAINTRGFDSVKTYIKVLKSEPGSTQQNTSLYLLYLMPIGLALPAVLLWFWYFYYSNGSGKKEKFNDSVIYEEIMNYSKPVENINIEYASRVTI